MGDEAIDARLQEWAAWLRGGRSGDGYPTTSVLHESWLPPAPGRAPTMRTSAPRAGDARHKATHAAIATLSVRLANTVVVHYCLRLPAARQAELLECAVSTVYMRLVEARRRIGLELADQRASAGLLRVIP